MNIVLSSMLYVLLIFLLLQHSAEDHEPTYTNYDEEDDDFIDETFISNSSGISARYGKPFPIVCKALYDFEVM